MANIAGRAVGKDQIEGLFKEVLDPQIFNLDPSSESIVAKLSHEFRHELENDFKTKNASKVLILME